MIPTGLSLEPLVVRSEEEGKRPPFVLRSPPGWVGPSASLPVLVLDLPRSRVNSRLRKDAVGTLIFSGVLYCPCSRLRCTLCPRGPIRGGDGSPSKVGVDRVPVEGLGPVHRRVCVGPHVCGEVSGEDPVTRGLLLPSTPKGYPRDPNVVPPSPWVLYGIRTGPP